MSVEANNNLSDHSANGKQWSINDFEIARPIGKGKYGTVYLAKETASQFEVALKVISKKDLPDEQITPQLRREIDIHISLRHPNVLRMYDYFEDESRVYLILDYAAKGDLYDLLISKSEQRFSEEESAVFVYQLSSALKYLHGVAVLHRDLKPQNILVGADGNIRVADFGWSTYAPALTRCKSFCGTLDYLPPEIVAGGLHHKMADVWSIGVLLFEFLVGKSPFEMGTSYFTYEQIVKCEYTFPDIVPPGAQDLITKILQKNPAERLSLDGIIQHPWILEHVEVADKSGEGEMEHHAA